MLKEKGYQIIDNFLPIEIANRLHDIYAQNEEWEEIDQVREKHYSHVFKTNNPALPSEEEAYLARFNRSQQLEKNDEINKIFEEHFFQKIKDISKAHLTETDIRCYKLEKGDFYRLHLDDYTSRINCIYYINKKWVWDWGGILNVCSFENPDEVYPMFPKFNRAVLLDNIKFKSPHFINAVSHFALEPRYTMVTFNK